MVLRLLLLVTATPTLKLTCQQAVTVVVCLFLR